MKCFIYSKYCLIFMEGQSNLKSNLKIVTDKPIRLTSAQQDVLNLFNHFKTVKYIAGQRNTSKSAVYKILDQLESLGLINKIGRRYVNIYSDKIKIRNILKKELPDNFIRLHLLEVHVSILYTSAKYFASLKTCNLVTYYGNKIKLNEKSIEIYLTESAGGEDVTRALALGFSLLDKVIRKLENDFGIILQKERSANTKIVNWHFSETDNELAKDLNEKKKVLHIYGREDGILWFLIDDSYNLNEAESVHPKSANVDMTAVKDVFNDVRENPTTFSKIKNDFNNRVESFEHKFDKFADRWIDLQNKQIEADERLAYNMNLHIDVLGKIGLGVDNLNLGISELRDELTIISLHRKAKELNSDIDKLKKDVFNSF